MAATRSDVNKSSKTGRGGPYARCKTCGVDLPTKDEQSAHMSETLQAAREADPGATSVSGHTTTVVNPTAEEVEVRPVQRVVEDAVERALSDCCERLDDEVRGGRVTEEQVINGLRYFDDFAEAWAEWVSADV